MSRAKATIRVGDLEINQDLRFQRRMWRAERIARWTLAGILVAAVLGLLGGGGWLSLRNLSTPQGSVQVEYPAYPRREASALLRIRLGPGLQEFWLESSYLENHLLTAIQPPPKATETHAGRILFRYPPADGISSIVLEFRPRALGPVQGQIGSGGESAQIRQWILP
ncbi:MAG TPA: hypothetical protein VJP40_08980 [bacterium]|nr:hypothetical protein [bacterium]